MYIKRKTDTNRKETVVLLNTIEILRLKYLFGPHFHSVCCRWSSF